MTKAAKTDKYKDDVVRQRCLQNGLYSEVGELCGVIDKADRSGERVNLERAKQELGDVGWYIARYAEIWSDAFDDPINWDHTSKGEANMDTFTEYAEELLDSCIAFREGSAEIPALAYAWCETCLIFGFTPCEVAQANLDKLQDRDARGVICGEGDDR